MSAMRDMRCERDHRPSSSAQCSVLAAARRSHWARYSSAVQNSKEQAARSRLQRVAACTPHATPTCDETNGPCVCPASGTHHMCSARHLSCLSLSGLAPCPTPPRIADDTPVPRPPPRTMRHLLSPPLSVRSRPEAPLCVRTTIRIPQQYRVVGPAPRARSPLRGGPACAPGS